MRSKLLFLVGLLFFSAFSNAQINNNAFTISLNPADLGTCGGANNTIEQASITGKKATMNTLLFTYSLPEGVEYVPGSVVINSQTGSGDFTVVEDNVTNLNEPVFKIERPSNANWAINDNVTFSITRVGLCESVVFLNSGGLFKDKHCIDYLDNGNSRHECDNDNAVSSYSLLAASLSLQSISTPTANVGENVTRNVTLTQGGNGSITFFNYYVVVGSSVDNVYQLSYKGTNLDPISTNADTLFYEFDLTQAPFAGKIGGDNNFDNGENIVFTENFTVEDCNETNIKHHAYWGCSFGDNCQESAPQTGGVNLGANVSNIKVTRTDGSAYVDVCNGIRYKIKVENTSTTAGSAAMDVLINVGLGSNNSSLTTYSSNPFWAFDYKNTRAVSNFQFVGGANVTPDNYASTTYPTRGSGYSFAFPPNFLTSDPDGAGVGLEDLDGDGFYDDLAPGASTELEFDFTVNPVTGCGTGRKYYLEWEHLYFDALAKDQCGNPRLTGRLNINYFNLGRDYSGHPTEFTTPSDIDTDSDFNVQIKPSVYTGGAGRLQCQGHDLFSNDANSVWTVSLTVPDGISLQGTPAGFSQTGNTITYTTTNMHSGYFEEWVDFPLHLDCGTYTAGGGGGTFTIDYKTHISCDCFDLDMHCGTFPPFHAHCTSGCSGPTILDLDAHRTSAGWTDNTMTAKVDLSTIDENELNRYLAGDTMQISTYATIHSYSADNLYLDITYTTSAGGGDADVISFIGGDIKIYNQSSGTYTSVTALTSNPSRVSSGYQHTVTFDLTAYRSLISNENYDSGDTIFINANYVFSKTFNTQTYFELANFRGDFYHDNVGTKVHCDTYGDAVFYGRVGYSGSNGTYTTQECTPRYLYNYLTRRANFGDLHPSEYRPSAHWDSTVVVLPQGARFTGVARWNIPGNPSIANGMITYTKTGNTLVFYPDRNAGYYDPDQGALAWYRLYVQVKGTCESNDGNNPFTSTHYFKDFAYSTPNDTTFTNNPNFNYTPPSFLVQSPSPTVNGDANVADFDIRLDNTATTTVDYNWLMFEPNSNITITGAYDITGGPEVPITMHQSGGYTWAECGAIANGSHSIIRFKGEFTNCSNQAVTFKHGWDCDAYPANFAELTATCYKNSVDINLEPKTAQIQMNITAQPGATVNLCDDFNIELDVLSVQVADATTPYVTFTAPSGLSGLTIGGADGKIDVEYPKNSGDIQAVSYTTSGNTVTINIIEHTVIAGLNGIMGTANASTVDERVVHIYVDMQATCDYISNTPITFKAFATSPCGDPAAGNGIRAISNNITITGATPPYDVFSTVTLPDNGSGQFGMNGCGTVGTVNIASTILNGTTGSADSAKVTLPAELEYVSASFVNNGADVAVFDRIEVNSGITDIYIKYPSGVPNGGVVDYSFNVQTTNSTCNESSQVDIVNYVNTSGITCGGTDCGNTQVSTGFSYENMPIKKPALVSAGLNSGFVVDDTDYSLTVTIANNSNDAVAGYEYNVYCSDASGQITGASIGSGNFSQAIPENDTITEVLNFNAINCGIDSVIVAIVPSGTNCMCEEFSFIVPFTRIYTPVANTDNANTTEDTNLVIDVQANDSDANGDPLITSIVSGPTSGGTAVVLNGDSISYTPLPNWCGVDTIIYQVCDATPLCDEAMVIIDVACVSDGGPNTTEDFVIATEDDTNISIDVLSNDNDPDGGDLALSSIVSQPSNGLAVIVGDEISYTPYADWCGQDTIIYEACDDEPLCINDTVFITVNCVNDRPTQGNENMDVDEDASLTTSIDLTLNNTDPEGTTTTVTTIVSSTGGGITTINGNSIDYTPAVNFNGVDTVIYTVCDAGVGSPATQCVTDTLFITVNAVNDSPVVDNENIGTVEDTPVSGDLTDLGDSDLETSLTANTTPISGPSNGSIIINPDGTYTYTPSSGFTGDDQVVVEICDNGLPLPAICVYDTIFIVVTSNQSPTDNAGNGNESMTVSEDDPATDSPNVLANNSDPEGDDMDVVIINPGNGTAVYDNVNDVIAYTPNPDFCGQDTVLYDVCDAYTCNHDTLFVTVTCVNDNPTGGNEYVDVDMNNPENNIDLSANNTDPDLDSLVVTVPGTTSEGGTITQNPDGTINYTPPTGYTGYDTLIYTVCDTVQPPLCVTDTAVFFITTDTDGDGIADYIDIDDDNDGILDIIEGNIDTDGDGIPNSLDLDSDGDGLTDAEESSWGNLYSDDDNDGIAGTGPFADSDGDGWSNWSENENPIIPDTDGDGIPNYLDLDSDGDGITDNVEGIDAANPTTPTGNDADGDGIDDAYDIDAGAIVVGLEDYDSDSYPNYLDIDSDNDGIIDNIEFQSTTGYVAPDADTDGNGLADNYETGAGTGVPSITPNNADGTDNPDYIDLDSDNDSRIDNFEVFQPETPTGNDSDSDGLDDRYDIDGTDTVNNGGATNGDENVLTYPNIQNPYTIEVDFRDPVNYLVPIDTDGDGITDDIDIDDDNDGILDVHEALGFIPSETLGAPCGHPASNFDAHTYIAGTGIDPISVGAQYRFTNVMTVNSNDLDAIVEITDIQGGAVLLDIDKGSSPEWQPEFTVPLPQSNTAEMKFKVTIVSAGTTTPYLLDRFGGVIYDIDGANAVESVILDRPGLYAVDNNTLLTVTPNPATGTIAFLGPDDTYSGVDLSPRLALYFNYYNIPQFDIRFSATLLSDQANTNLGSVSFDVCKINGLFDPSNTTSANPTQTNGSFEPSGPATGYTYVVNDGPDTDGDGISDDKDLDSDNDGITDVIEAGGNDTDGDGHPGTAYDPIDVDADGLPNVQNGTPIDMVDNDGDGIPDHLDLDSDNDGIADLIEAGGTDDNGNGMLEGDDVDQDGFIDSVDPLNDDTFTASGETALPINDSDGDGNKDYLDLDSDNDGIADVIEAGGTDPDGDGIIGTGGITDNNANGWSKLADFNEAGIALPYTDNDGDGLYNWVDIDSDNDGIMDIVEAGGTDTDNDGQVDYVTSGDPITLADTDGDGFGDVVDTDDSGTNLIIEDIDTDSYPSFLDIDSDNDGIIDNIEGQTTADYIAPIGTDTDGDGLDDAYDTDNGGTAIIPINTDGTDEPDYLDLDSDNDSYDDATEGWDTNNDGVADTTPIGNDSDNDGLDDAYDVDGTSTDNSGGATNNGTVPTDFPDLDNAGGDMDWRETLDTDGDGISDDVDLDSDNDGILDTVEGTGDTDGDGIPDYLDLDSDNDGIPDIAEAGGTDTDGDGQVDNFTDANNDGMDDILAANPLLNEDADGDGIPNRLDLDSDNDGTPDVAENGGTDTNGDGILDGYVDVDGDGFNDLVDTDDNTQVGTGDGGTALIVPDTDGDTNPDYLDLDSDNDGIPDVTENGGTDADGDGILDGFVDADGDGFNDLVDTDNGGTSGTPLPNGDFDKDGIPNAQDIDSDNDGITDVVEAGGTDADGDGTLDDFADVDGDGFSDVVDTDDNTTAGTADGGTGLNITNTDGTAGPNYLDIDADDDGIADNIEGQSTTGYVAPTGTDTDGDGLDDAYDTDNGGTAIIPENTDGTDEPDYLDLDSDNDGISDNIEGWDTNKDGVADIVPTGTDTDGDGLDDAFDTVVLDGTTSGTNAANGTIYPLTDGVLANVDNDSSDLDYRSLDNQNPVIEEDIISDTTTMNTPITICIKATDADNDTLGICDINPMPENGIVTNYTDSTLCFTYTPDANYVGGDTLSAVVCDGNGGSDTVVVVIDVIPIPNEDPVVAEDTINKTTPIDTPVEVCITATDADGDTPGICDINPMPKNGIVTNYTDSTLCFTYTPDANYVGSDIMSVIVCDGNGGSDTVEVVIDVTPEDEIYIPGGFSPNGDNVNDVFVIRGTSSSENTKLTIYNRWGNKVYEASPYNNDWDGNNMFGISIGNELPVGTYFYIFEIDGEFKKKGYIYLNR